MIVNSLQVLMPEQSNRCKIIFPQWRSVLVGLSAVFGLCCGFSCIAQKAPIELEPAELFTTPRHYAAPFVPVAPVVDGNLNDQAWQMARWSNAFVDIEGDRQPAPALLTRVKMVWNDTCLFVAAEMEEPHVWGTLKQHDEVVFHDNDFEVFIDPDNDTHQYYEIEVNALNTIFDLFLARPYRNGGNAMISWHADRLKSAVEIQGTLNQPGDQDTGWTVEMAIPFRALSLGNVTQLPKEGTRWRINFSRVEWDTEIREGKYRKKTDSNGRPLPEHNWVWSPQGVINMHYPERWGYLTFTRQDQGGEEGAFELPYAEKQKQRLWQIYYQQKKYYEKHRRYATSLADLGIKQKQFFIDNQKKQLHLEAGRYQFTAWIESPKQPVWRIDQDGRIQSHLLNP